jgi:segregation and condensation protein A
VPYAVQTDVFEGPFDLLLHLILREEVDLYEISLRTIVDAYLGELARMETLDLEVATEFLLIAAILVELKTKRLLPDEHDGELDDEFGLWEQRDLLLSRLVECKTFKDASRVLEGLFREAGRSFARAVGPDERFVDLTPDLLEGVGPDDVRRAFFRATRPKPVPHVNLEHVTIVRASVSAAIEEIADELLRSGEATFRELTTGLVDTIEMVVRFLAVLELYKQGLVELDQLTSFGEIRVSWLGSSVHESFDHELVDAYDG